MLQSLKRKFFQSGTTESRRRQTNRSMSEPVEALEVRALLAGNVLVSVNASGNLTLKGDNFNNAVRVDPVVGGIKVTGLPDEIDGVTTTLGNGETERVFMGDQFVRGNLKVQMKGGTDELYSTVDVQKNVSVNMGKGADILEISGTTIDGNAKLNLGASGPGEIAAVILSDVVVEGKAVVKGGGGSQIAYIEDSSFSQQISVNLGGGNDVLDIADTSFNAFKFNGGGGTDLFLLSPGGGRSVDSKGFENFDDD
ncbi:MAG: hypothetical protein AB8G99_03225 [Planctomycetaceae bacterium]